MKTLIELYDDQSVLNLLAVCALHPEPEDVVFIGEFPSNKRVRELKEWVDGFLSERGIRTVTHFRSVNASDCTDIIDTLDAVEREFEDCALEVCGGKYLVLLAAGIFAEHVDIPIFHYNIEKRRFEDIRGIGEVNKISPPHFTARDMLELTHAGIMGYGYFSAAELDFSMRNDVRELWMLFLAYKDSWHKKMLFFQKAGGPEEAPLNVDCPRDVVPGIAIEDNFFRDLERSCMITGLSLSDTRVRFNYKNGLVKAALTSAGAALELFTYTSIKKRPDLFDDCEIDIRVDWDGDGPSQTNNELDIVAVSGVSTLFISCKSGKLDSDYLNEIYTLTYRLGGVFAKPVLMTAALFPGTDNSTVLQRGYDLGIEQITLSEICPVIYEYGKTDLNRCRFCANKECENNLAERLYDICGND